MIFRPAESSKKIVEFYKKYLLTTFQTDNEVYNKQFREQLNAQNDEIIAKGPFISLSDAFAAGKSTEELMNEGLLVKSFRKIKKMNFPKTHKHQTEAITKAKGGKNLIITTGTGSGKTESFLFPVLNRLLEEEENGTLDAGVRTLIIYPMNALVNDQIKRLRKIFKDTDTQITFGRYTGDTVEKQSDAEKEFQKLYKTSPIKNELISREQIRLTPPNILITNYAMLEYLLLRPDDNIFFNPEQAKKWQFIVLDEAHTYEGAKGIEVGTLIRRVKATLDRDDINFILTSATLGSKEDNDKIIKFGELLCDAKFDEASIIRSETVKPEISSDLRDIDLKIYKEIASKLKNCDEKKEIIDYLKSQNIEIIEGEDESKTLELSLYNLVLHDVLYKKTREFLSSGPRELKDVINILEISEEDFTDFITVASNAKKNDNKIFDAKYHMFIKGVEGVYITLKPSQKLFTKKQTTYKDFDYAPVNNEFKVFEIRFCSNCNASFITGEIINMNGTDFLIQRSRLSDDYNPEVYMLNNKGIDDSEDEEEVSEEKKADDSDNEFVICPQCGAIKKATAINPLACGHNPQNFQRLIRVQEHGEVLKTCPSCHTKNSKRSILRPYYIGNEAATSVIAMALYNELPAEIIKEKKTEEVEESFFSAPEVKETEEFGVKQFLTFSDSRQAAAFFASYLQHTYTSNLLKCLLVEITKTHRAKLAAGMYVYEFVAFLTDLLKERRIFEEPDNSLPRNEYNEAYINVFNEILNVKSKSSLQNKGYILFDINDITTQKLCDLTVEETNNLIKTLLMELIKCQAVNDFAELSNADKCRYLRNGKQGAFDLHPCSDKYVKSWLPKKGKNKRIKYLAKLFPNFTQEQLEKMLEQIWKMCVAKEFIVDSKKNVNAHYFNINKITVKTPQKLYICPECKTITPYNVKDICPQCYGKLEEFDYEKALSENFYNETYTNLNMDKICVREHTAQLDTELATIYQNAFIDKKINVLSCSTTFEMGVDVGTLETVFMRNMPPAPSNYAQRAGRAGRGTNAAAYAITYCPNSSHDLNYFRDPVKMIVGKINPPNFNINNDKIVLRHIFASAFASFGHEHPEYHTKFIGEFFDMGGFRQFENYLDQKPERLKRYLLKLVKDKALRKQFDIENFGWAKLLFNDNPQEPGVFNIAHRKYKETLDDLENAKKEIDNRILSADYKEQNVYSSGRNILKSIKTLKDQPLIEFLSKNNLIPKYGFPVDSVELESFNKKDCPSQLRLDRDLLNAISEYAPGSEIVANGKLIKSRYVKALPGYAWPSCPYKVCPKCKTLIRRKSGYGEAIVKCETCGEDLSQEKVYQYIIPKFGFVAENEEPPEAGTEKPIKTYRGEILYIGDQNNVIGKKGFKICQEVELEITSSKMDELAVINKSKFYSCPTCGYTELHEEKYTPSIQKTHKKTNGYACPNKTLEQYSLGHEFQTDVVMLRFKNLQVDDPKHAWSILYSLLEGLSKQIPVNRNEVSGCLYWNRDEETGEGGYSFILFDNTPGGAGYVSQLLDRRTLKGTLEWGYRNVKGCQCGGEEGDTACYGCLCNYYNQKRHDDLKRKYAIAFYERILPYENGDFEVEDFEEEDSKNVNIFGTQVLKYTGKGTNLEDYDYIKEDTEEKCELEFFDYLQNLQDLQACEKPIYHAELIFANQDKITADLMFGNAKILFFLKENEEVYEKAKESCWHVFCLAEDFDFAIIKDILLKGE